MRYSPGFAAPETDTARMDAAPGVVARIDLTRLTAKAPLHRPSVTGGTGPGASSHIPGAAHPPAASMVNLSDGTRISFGAVDEVPVLEYA